MENLKEDILKMALKECDPKLVYAFLLLEKEVTELKRQVNRLEARVKNEPYNKAKQE